MSDSVTVNLRLEGVILEALRELNMDFCGGSVQPTEDLLPVLLIVLDHVATGVLRPGSWEHSFVVGIFGDA